MFITESKAGVSEDVRLRFCRNRRDFRPTEWHSPRVSVEKRPIIFLAASQFRGWIIQRPNALARQRLSQFEGYVKWGLQMRPPFPGPRSIERDPSQPSLSQDSLRATVFLAQTHLIYQTDDDWASITDHWLIFQWQITGTEMWIRRGKTWLTVAWPCFDHPAICKFKLPNISRHLKKNIWVIKAAWNKL